MEKKTRVRFAPSPTGPLHIGGVRTALYNYLFAKQKGGTFILRIEDTDYQRFVKGAEKYIIESLEWCGISPYEGVENGQIVSEPSAKHPHAPYRQSQRKEIYKKYAKKLIDNGDAYYSFDTTQELATLREEAILEGGTFTYNHRVRENLNNSLNLTFEETQKKLLENNNWVIRYKTPINKIIQMEDAIRGKIEVNSSTLDDKVLWKASDQLPTYHLANIVDDKLMEISDVIRGEEWLPSLPLHYMLYDSFGWQEERPTFAHLSLLLKPDGKGKLSKRDGDRLGFPVFPLEWKSEQGEISKGYREEGYYPEAFVNMLAFLGWNPGTEQEIFNLEELTNSFSLERVVKSGAKFNLEKAKWFNQEYLRTKTTKQLALEFTPMLKSKGIVKETSYIEHAVELIRDRIFFVHEIWPLSDYLFEAPTTFDQKVKAKFWKEEMPAIILEVKEFLNSLENFSKESIESQLPTLIKEREWKMGAVMNSLRLLLVGESKGPGIADIMSLIGKQETIARLSNQI